MQKFLLGLALLLSIQSNASENYKSAKREPGRSYLEYMREAMRQPRESGGIGDTRSALDSAVSYGKSILPQPTEWATEAEMQQHFEAIRNERWMETSDHKGFLRRSSWLYPDDGCFARAALAIMNLVKWKVTPASKIFAFGNLDVKTSNSTQGHVTWWYHVAPLVRVANENYVLDPALEPKHPLKMDDWLKLMISDTSQLRVAVCGSGSYAPYDTCQKETDGVEQEGLQDQESYLYNEWTRQEQLNRDPEKVLGELPPW